MPTLIYATTGTLETLKAQLNKTYSRIIALVAHPDAQEELQVLAANHPNLQWQLAALATQSGEALLNLTNLPAASSLERPTGIKKLYPNLYIETTRPIECVTLDELIKAHNLDNEKDNTLILETNGQEAAILQQLHDQQQLHLFKEIQARVGREALYDQAATRDELVELLKQQAYELHPQKQPDPEQPRLIFKLNKKQLKANQQLEKLNQQLAALTAQEKNLKEEQQKSQTEKEQLAQEMSKLKKERDQLKNDNKTLEAEKNKLQEKLQEIEKKLSQDKEKLQQECDQLKQDKESLVIEKEKLKDQIETTEQKLAETQKNFSNRKKQALEGQEKIKELTHQLELSQKDLEQAQKELKGQAEQNKQLKSLQERLDYLFSQQTLQLEQAANALGQHITQRSEQGTEEVKSFIQVQQQLGSNTQALNYQNQQLAANLALYLKQRLATHNYDLIIDLSAGVSTSYLAVQLQEQAPTKARISQANRQQPEAYPVAEEGELPKRILAFSHQRQACKELSEHLQQQGQQHLVDLVFAPLVDCRLNGQDYLYYDASKTLSRIADLLERRQGKLLVLLNLEQQPEQLNPEASLPSLLQHLASQSLEVVVYPLNHLKTGQMQNTWTQLLNQRELEYQLQEDPHNNSLIFKIN